MKRILSGMDEAVANWVVARVPYMSLGDSPYSAIGLVDGAGYLHAGIVYSTYTGNDIVLHIALLSRKSITRKFIEEGFKYPFIQLNCSRVTVMVAAGNRASHEFVKRLGWTKEGVLREWYADGQDGVVYGMLRRECRWIHPRKHYGKRNARNGPRDDGRDGRRDTPSARTH